MIVASLQFQVRREKRSEFLRAAENFVSTLRQSPGCVECRLLVDCESRDRYTVSSRWDETSQLRLFLDSNEFRALLGTRILLHGPPNISIDEVVRCTRLPGRGPFRLAW